VLDDLFCIHANLHHRPHVHMLSSNRNHSSYLPHSLAVSIAKPSSASRPQLKVRSISTAPVGVGCSSQGKLLPPSRRLCDLGLRCAVRIPSIYLDISILITPRRFDGLRLHNRPILLIPPPNIGGTSPYMNTALRTIHWRKYCH
jgi:hypothetical protein